MSKLKISFIILFSLIILVFILFIVLTKQGKNIINDSSEPNADFTSSSNWAESMANQYPFNNSTGSGVVVFPASNDKILIIGKLINLSDKTALISIGNQQIEIDITSDTRFIYSSPARDNPVYKQVHMSQIETNANVNVLAIMGDKPIAEEFQQIL